MAQMNLSIARDAEQLRRMKKHQQEGTCHFCPEGFKEHTAPIIKEGKYWFITANDNPYPGTVHHYLIVSKRHITRETELSREEWLEKLEMLQWLENHLHPEGFSEFSRNGDLAHTHASLDHLHFHFLVGVKGENTGTEKIKVTLAYKKSPGV